MIDRLAAVLRDAPGAVAALRREPVADVVDAARQHGVLPLLAEQLAPATDVPPDLRSTLADEARRGAAADLVREQALRALIDAATAARLPFLLVKGAHLAYALYPRPDLRPRIDTDVLVPAHAVPAAERVLAALGYVKDPPGGGDLIFYQALFALRRGGDLIHVVDLHWRVANPQTFGGVFEWSALDARAGAIEGLPGARSPHDVDALLLACVHQVAHHPNDARLIWFEDVRRLAARMTSGDWESFAARAAERRVGVVCGRVLARTAALLGAPIPAHVLGDARLSADRAGAEPSAGWLEPGRTRVQTFTEDLSRLPGWHARARLVRQYMFPTPSYMRTVYAPASRWPLPALYAQRAWRGAWRWLRGA